MAKSKKPAKTGTKSKVIIIDVNGARTTVAPDYRAIRTALDAHLQVIPLPDRSVLLVEEVGRYTQEYNETATELVFGMFPVHGKVAHVPESLIEQVVPSYLRHQIPKRRAR